MRVVSKEILHRSPGKGTLVYWHTFYTRATGDILLHVSRWLMPEWIGDAYVYRIAP